MTLNLNPAANLFIGAAMAVSALALHEAGHVLAVKFLGGGVDQIRVFPLGLAARFTGLEKLRPWERYAVYAAGAMANGAAAAWLFTVSRISYIGVPWLETLAFYHLALGLFNLTPALPLDGGRVLRQFLSNRLGMRRANRAMARLGAWVGAALMLLGLAQLILYPYNITLLCAGLYIKRKNKAMAPYLEMEFFKILAAKNALSKTRRLPIKKVTLAGDATLKQAMGYLTMDSLTVFYIKEKERVLWEGALLKHVFAYGLQGAVGDLLTD
ncbi:MAG: site-2 protease family protein [Defluviitaleaceae bacterium]|nr:site-2 protease family protein [Defluviitaleaceae bacterium]